MKHRRKISTALLARRFSRVISVSVAVGLTLGVGASLAAYAQHSTHTQRATGEWAWPNGLPGTPAPPSALLDGVAGQASVALSGVRAVATAGAGQHATTLLAGSTGASGAPSCFAAAGNGWISQFHCGFPTTGAFVVRESSGGPALGTTSWYSIVGIARGDIASVVLRFDGGTQQSLALSADRAFSYSGSAAPIRIDGYDSSGATVGSEALN